MNAHCTSPILFYVFFNVTEYILSRSSSSGVETLEESASPDLHLE